MCNLFARNRSNIWSLSDCNGTRTHNHLVRKRTLNQLLCKLLWIQKLINIKTLLQHQAKFINVFHTKFVDVSKSFAWIFLKFFSWVFLQSKQLKSNKSTLALTQSFIKLLYIDFNTCIHFFKWRFCQHKEQMELS